MAPKAEIKQNKKDLVSSIADKLGDSKSVVFVDYTGMGVKLQQDFKTKLRDIGANMFVAKNTLIKLAGKKADLPEEVTSDTVLSGQTAIITSGEDPVASIQILGKFAKDNEIPKIKAGVVEGVYQDAEAVKRISTLPSKEQLQADVLGAIAAPMYGLVGTLQGNMQKLVYILSEASKKESN